MGSRHPEPTERNPAEVYIGSLAAGSRRTMRQALDVVAAMIERGATALTCSWERVEYAEVAAVRAKLAARYAPSTANKLLAALRGVLRAAFLLGGIGADQYGRVVQVKPVRGTRLPNGRALVLAEVKALFNVCDPETPGGARDAALLAILVACGLRRSEIVTLDLGDFDATAGMLRVRGKGNRERTCFVVGRARAALDGWLRYCDSGPGPLFTPVNKGGTVIARRMTDQSVLDIVQRLARRAGLASVSPHDFRRTLIGSMLTAGIDLATVARVVGHAQVATTARYDRRGDAAKRRAAELIVVPFGDR